MVNYRAPTGQLISLQFESQQNKSLELLTCQVCCIAELAPVDRIMPMPTMELTQ